MPDVGEFHQGELEGAQCRSVLMNLRFVRVEDLPRL